MRRRGMKMERVETWRRGMGIGIGMGMIWFGVREESWGRHRGKRVRTGEEGRRENDW
jgi:hypothetical protein